MQDLSRIERYMGFLTREWAKLAPLSLVPATDPPVQRTHVLDRTIEQVAAEPGIRLEFGVWQGRSIQRCAEAQPDRQWVGFDSFEGFPDDGRIDWQKPFKVIELPDTPPNVTLVKGYFSDTLEPFLAATPDQIGFVNIDCDIYSSTVDILTALERHNRLRPGLVIYFDELINYPEYMWNESLALYEMLERTGYGIEWICHNHLLRPPEETCRHFHNADHPRWLDDTRASYWQQASLRLTTAGLDIGPVDDPAYRDKLAWMAEGFTQRESVRTAAYMARQDRLREQVRLREEREIERKRRDAERAQARREARRAERRARAGNTE